MPVKESILLNEQTILRNELQELKRCQLQYFLLSIGATGAFFGFNKDLVGEIKTGSVLYLAPLIIILPCWLTFFDKANTITRLTGYIRTFIEDQLNKENTAYSYIGYENALSEFRRNEMKFAKELRGLKKLEKPGWKSVFNFTRNQYWKINWLTFFLLSATCCFYPFLKDKASLFQHPDSIAIVYMFILFVFICAFYTAFMLWRLTFDVYSYENVKKIWDKVFDNR
jgi:hypothetical protein